MKQITLGSFIRSLRIQNQMTQAQLAERLCVTDKAVSKWERDLSCPDITLLSKLADTLGVTVDDLLHEGIEEGKPSRLLQIIEMSHDIRTPLHVILGCVELAETHRDDEILLKRYLDGIRIAGEYLMRSVDRMTQVTKQDREEDTMPKASADTPGFGEYLNERAEERKNQQKEYDFSGKSVLVAEDISLNREIVKEILKQTGAEAAFAEDGKSCLEMVETAPAGTYDLILMDLMMPNMDGCEAARRIRNLSDPKKAEIPIIALSANVYEKDRNRAFAAGMNNFVEKPIDIDKLFEIMKQSF